MALQPTQFNNSVLGALPPYARKIGSGIYAAATVGNRVLAQPDPLGAYVGSSPVVAWAPVVENLEPLGRLVVRYDDTKGATTQSNGNPVSQYPHGLYVEANAPQALPRYVLPYEWVVAAQYAGWGIQVFVDPTAAPTITSTSCYVFHNGAPMSTAPASAPTIPAGPGTYCVVSAESLSIPVPAKPALGVLTSE